MTDKPLVSVPEFNLQFNTAKTLVRHEDSTVEAEQERLWKLVPLMTADDRAWATRMIDRLSAVTAPPAPQTALMAEAVAVVEAARDQLRRLTEQAPAHEGAGLRGLTRSLDELLEAYDDPLWEFPIPAKP